MKVCAGDMHEGIRIATHMLTEDPDIPYKNKA